MIREIPMEKVICIINIDNFIDLLEMVIKAATAAALYIINYFNIIKYAYIYNFVIIILYIIGMILFLLFNYRRKQIALIKIINKITYESF